MPFMIETNTSRVIDISVSKGSVELHFRVFGIDDEQVVSQLVEQALPLKFRGVPLDGYRMEPIEAGNWDIVARYNTQSQDLNDPTNEMASFSFDTTGGKKKIRQSLEVMDEAAIITRAPTDHGGLIGVNGDKVEGIEVPAPQFKFSITGHLPQALVTFDYAAIVEELTGTVNDKTFKHFPKGEVLFLGAKGGWRGREKAEMTFDFAASRNRDDVRVGSGVDAIPPMDMGPFVKEGWWYLDVTYEDAKDDVAKKLGKKAYAAYIHRVMEYGDFALLGIGT